MKTKEELLLFIKERNPKNLCKLSLTDKQQNCPNCFLNNSTKDSVQYFHCLLLGNVASFDIFPTIEKLIKRFPTLLIEDNKNENN